MTGPRRSILCFATQGTGSGDEARIKALMADHEVTMFAFDRSRKKQMPLALVRAVRRQRPRLVVMEGSGLAGGLSLLICRVLFGTRYVVSSGDAIGPFFELLKPGAGPIGRLYERLLMRHCAGFIGWTPYLVGRAVTYGAPRAMSAGNWSSLPEARIGREAIRSQLGIPPDALVFGIVGSLVWKEPPAYCYGLDLVEAIRRTARQDVYVLVVGGGSGLDVLRDRADGDGRVVLTGPVGSEAVADHLAAMDVAALPQSTDEIGSLRYTTKLSEYLHAGLPVVTGQIPLAYDLDGGWIWRLPGQSPWDEQYVQALAHLMETLDSDTLAQRRAAVPSELPLFDAADQRRRVTAFIADLVG